MTDTDRIGDILSLVRETRDDLKGVHKALFGNGGSGALEDLRVVTRIVDGHITEHAARVEGAAALRRGIATRALNVVERTVPWAVLGGLLAGQLSGGF